MTTSSITWAQQYRHDWIVETVGIFGFINRDHIVKKFRVSIPQASIDLKQVMHKHPELISYDASAKTYKLRVKAVNV